MELNFERFAALVSAAVDLDALSRHEYLIRPHFDPSLAELGDERDSVSDISATVRVTPAVCVDLVVSSVLKCDYEYLIRRVNPTYTVRVWVNFPCVCHCGLILRIDGSI